MFLEIGVKSIKFLNLWNDNVFLFFLYILLGFFVNVIVVVKLF